MICTSLNVIGDVGPMLLSLKEGQSQLKSMCTNIGAKQGSMAQALGELKDLLTARPVFSENS